MTKYEELKKIICEALPRLKTVNGAFTFYAEPLLSDVIQWMELHKLSFQFYESIILKIIWDWNLPQPLLKDQSEELIDYLLSIKK